MPGQEEEAAVAVEEQQPTSPDQWNRGQTVGSTVGFIVELPSGNVARVRRTLDLPTMLKAGRIPNPLADTIAKSIAGGGDGIEPSELDRTQLMQMLDLVDSVVARMMVEPKVSAPEPRMPDEEDEIYSKRLDSWVPDEGTLSIFDLELNDKMFLFYVGQGAAVDLQRFREESGLAVAGVPTVEDVQQPPVETPGTE